MSNKHQELKFDDIESCRLPGRVEEILFALDQERPDRSQIHVLDLGCGRGAHVFKLRQIGYSTYGIDVDPNVVRNGQKLFNDHGLDHSSIIKLVCPGSVWPFEDGFFDLVFSDQVFEHVSDLNGVIAEISRVTKAGGVSFHRFPAQFIRVEPHVFVPFVHWLPKIVLIRAVWLDIFYDRLPLWNGQERLGRKKRIHEFVEYLNRKTYYRSIDRYLRLFVKAGFTAKLDRPTGPSDWNLLSASKQRIKSKYYSTFISAEIIAVRC
jgi:SAM-dependent methyltransferase